MKIVQKTLFDELKVKYDFMIGWGVARNEYERKYNPLMYHMDYMIDGQGRSVGSIVCGMKICDKSILNDMKDKKICFIIFPNIEDDVIEEVEKIGIKEFDTIVSSLLFLDETFYVRSFSERLEDVIFLAAMRKFNVSNPVYVDIGVCHPVIRNNTYLFYENGMREGLLIEPNPDMCKLIKEYRPQNQIVEAGVCGKSSGGG